MYGSKVDNLKFLQERGINVPEFEVVAFSDAIDNAEDFAKYYREQLSKSTVRAAQNIEKYLREHIKIERDFDVVASSYAVRSSSNLEDGSKDSFAGQFKSFMRVAPTRLKGRIEECFLSLASENVIDYLKHKQISPAQVEMNVMIQRMVEADFAGVVFTANPQGLLNETVITVGAGLGEGVVSEKTNTTSYYYNRTDDVYYFDGSKDFLDAKMVEKIIAEVSKIECVLGKYLDIEFAIKDGELFILQARPITTLKANNLLVMDNSNIVESYPGISLPLTISFAELIYSCVFESECRRVLKDEKELEKQRKIFSQMVGSSNGRMYYKISNWYALIDYLPFSKKITPIWEEMLGIKNAVKHQPQAGLKLHARVAKNYLKELRKVSSNMDWLNAHFLLVEKEFRAKFSENPDLDQTLKLFHHVADQLIPHWDYTLINDMYAFVMVGILKKRLGDKANAYISNISNLESMKPVQEMICLAFSKDKISEDEYKERFDNYLTVYGDRNVEELKLESKTFRTNPELLKARIEEYREHPRNLEKLYESIMHPEKKSEGKLDRISASILHCAETGIRNREISRLNRSRIFGMVRDIFLRAGELIAKEGNLARKSDVFYLNIEEVEAYGKKKCDFKEIVAGRKAQYKIYEQLPGYSKLIFSEKEFDKLPTRINSHEQKISEHALMGTPCSEGLVTAKVVVVESAQDATDTNNRIIVTRSTDPGWVFMLSTAKGVISERGSLLSHTAIISRELGVPAVVGVKDATKLLKTGDLITLNGRTGEIRIEKQK